MNAGAEFIRNNAEKVQAIERLFQFIPFMICNHDSIVQVQGALMVGRVVGLVNRLCLDSENSLGLRVQELNNELDALRGGALAAAAQARVARESGEDMMMRDDEEIDPNAPSGGTKQHRPTSFYRTIASLDPTAKSIIGTHQRTIAADVALQFLDVVDVFVELLVRNPPKALSTFMTQHCSMLFSSAASSSSSPAWLMEQRARSCAGWGIVLGISAVRSGLGLYLQRQEVGSVLLSAGAHFRMMYRRVVKMARHLSRRQRKHRTALVDDQLGDSASTATARPSTETAESLQLAIRVASPGLVIPSVRVPVRSSLSARHGSRSVRQPSAALAADDYDYRSSSVIGRRRQEMEVTVTMASSPSPQRPDQQDTTTTDTTSLSPLPRTVVAAASSSRVPHPHHYTQEDLGLPPNVHLRSFTEYVAFLLDMMGIFTPMLWSGIAYLHRPAGLLGGGVSATEARARLHNSTSTRTAAVGGSSAFGAKWGTWLGSIVSRLTAARPATSTTSSSSDTSLKIRRFCPSPALAGTIQQSWGAWRVMLALDIVRLVVALLVKSIRRPTVVVTGGSSTNNTSTTHSPHHLADLNRASSALRTIGGHCLTDPYFTVVIRSWIEDHIIRGRISRVPLVGSIVASQVAFILTLQRNSFTYTNK